MIVVYTMALHIFIRKHAGLDDADFMEYENNDNAYEDIIDPENVEDGDSDDDGELNASSDCVHFDLLATLESKKRHDIQSHLLRCTGNSLSKPHLGTEQNFLFVTVQSDSMKAVNLLKKSQTSPSSLPLVQAIQNLRKRSWELSIHWTPRQGRNPLRGGQEPLL
ncbi:hypothetical protein V6N12_043136 [Hibiscus sabdariffa]|uniref:RNase H type-1 domain-containing protein n=1 Tax=Hibiscus sabdariffa TaxID=183260 RepID=A0ABR2DIC2_9ROSI